MGRNGMGFFEWKALLASSNADGSKSSALAPLHWTIGLLVVAVCSLSKTGAPTWCVVGAMIFLGVAVAVDLFAFCYLLFNDRDALRSERFSLQKLRIERGLIGDNRVGLLEESPQSKALTLIETGDEDA
jgi:hypothetical protein